MDIYCRRIPVAARWRVEHARRRSARVRYQYTAHQQLPILNFLHQELSPVEVILRWHLRMFIDPLIRPSCFGVSGPRGLLSIPELLEIWTRFRIALTFSCSGKSSRQNLVLFWSLNFMNCIPALDDKLSVVGTWRHLEGI